VIRNCREVVILDGDPYPLLRFHRPARLRHSSVSREAHQAGRSAATAAAGRPASGAFPFEVFQRSTTVVSRSGENIDSLSWSRLLCRVLYALQYRGHGFPRSHLDLVVSGGRGGLPATPFPSSHCLAMADHPLVSFALLQSPLGCRPPACAHRTGHLPWGSLPLRDVSA
jgi:hypothetical protein